LGTTAASSDTLAISVAAVGKPSGTHKMILSIKGVIGKTGNAYQVSRRVIRIESRSVRITNQFRREALGMSARQYLIPDAVQAR